MYGDHTSRSKNSLPGTSHGKTSSSHGTGSSNNPGTSHGPSKGAASRKGSPGGSGGEHLVGSSYGGGGGSSHGSSYGNIMSGVDTSVGSVSSSALGLQSRNKPHIVKDPKQRQSMDGPMITMEVMAWVQRVTCDMACVACVMRESAERCLQVLIDLKSPRQGGGAYSTSRSAIC
jgi:hypothetical protein